MNFAERVIDYHLELKPDWKLPKGIDLIFPFDGDETIDVFSQFYRKYFSDDKERSCLFGINPGRFGAGVTGIPFTDPKILENQCGISNTFQKRNELSSVFVYEFIEAMGGIETFYTDFYITSLCPLGFIADGKNCNYYDDKKLEKAVEKHIVTNIKEHIKLGCRSNVGFSIGMGKNLKYFQKINEKHGFFDQVVGLPHPRWVMQYRLKRKQEFLDEYVVKLTSVLR